MKISFRFLDGALLVAAFAFTYAGSASCDPYPLDKCIVSGEKLGTMGAPYIFDYKGREIRFCCPACKPKFEAAPAEYLKKLDAEIVKQQTPLYPLDTCVVLGGKLGDGAVNFVYKNRLIRFCCPMCETTFLQNPAKYLEKIDAAVVAKQKPAYPLDTCVVSGKKLGDGAVDYVYGNRLVRFCGKGCINEFEKDPLKYTAKLDAAGKK